MKQDMAPKEIIEPPLKLKKEVGVVALLLILVHISANAALMIGMIAATLILPYLLVKLIILSLLWIHKRLSERAFQIRKTLIRIASITILCGGSIHGVYFIHGHIMKSFEPVIQQVDAYRADHGHYPANLSFYKSSLPSCGVIAGLPPAPLYYFVDQESDRYSIVCVTFGFNKLYYDGNDKRWKNFD